MRLDLEHAAGDVEVLLLAVLVLDPHITRLQTADEGGMPGRDTDLAQLGGRIHHGRLTRMNRPFGAYDIDVNCHRHSAPLLNRALLSHTTLSRNPPAADFNRVVPTRFKNKK
jgi:hypothetical protein